MDVFLDNILLFIIFSPLVAALVVLLLPGGVVGLIPKLQNILRRVVSRLRNGDQAEQHANT